MLKRYEPRLRNAPRTTSLECPIDAHKLLRDACSSWLEVCDAHPGIVWTPMLQRHWGKLAPTLERSGLARLLFKSPASGAMTILAAACAPRNPPAAWGERSRWSRGWREGPYFVNGRPGGFASRESRSVEAAKRTWALGGAHTSCRERGGACRVRASTTRRGCGPGGRGGGRGERGGALAGKRRISIVTCFTVFSCNCVYRAPRQPTDGSVH